MERILEILKNNFPEQTYRSCEKTAEELAKIIDLRKELIDYTKSKGLKPIWERNEIEYIDEYLKSRSDSKTVTDEMIDDFYPITSDTTALTWDFVRINKARREGAKAYRDGLITKQKEDERRNIQEGLYPVSG